KLGIGNRRRDRGIHQDRVFRHIEAAGQRRGKCSEAKLALIHKGAVKPVLIGILIWNEHFRESPLVKHRSTIEMGQRNDGSGAALETQMETPVPPVDEVPVDRKIQTLRLGYANWLHRRLQSVTSGDGRFIEVMIVGGQGNDSGI